MTKSEKKKLLKALEHDSRQVTKVTSEMFRARNACLDYQDELRNLAFQIELDSLEVRKLKRSMAKLEKLSSIADGAWAKMNYVAEDHVATYVDEEPEWASLMRQYMPGVIR